MIKKVRIRGYRKFIDETVIANPVLNIFVGDNESGKSTLLEAISLALTGRIDGRSAMDHLNPYWFNAELVQGFFDQVENGEHPPLPEIEIEVFLEDRDEFARDFLGANNSEEPTKSSPGVKLCVVPDQEYLEEILAFIKGGSRIIPVEYYQVIWETFTGQQLTRKPRELTVAVVDSSTVQARYGVDQHIRQILRDFLEPQERAQVALAYRSVKELLTEKHLKSVNEKLSELDGPIDHGKLSIAMDQSSRGSWDASVVPHLDSIPFSLSGQGQQASAKIALSVRESAASAKAILIEEPENHLSYTRLNVLLSRIHSLTENHCQLFITTHSSFVLNRLGLNSLRLVSSGRVSTFSDLSVETERYYQKLPGYDTLRMVLAEKVVLVEGPSDEFLFERFYQDRYARRPLEDGIDVISMRGLSLRTNLELAKVLEKRCAVLRDNDGKSHNAIKEGLGDLVDGFRRQVFIGSENHGRSLEDQLLKVNGEEAIREALNISSANLLTWMTTNKTEAAMRIAESLNQLDAPDYFHRAMEFIRG